MSIEPTILFNKVLLNVVFFSNQHSSTTIFFSKAFLLTLVSSNYRPLDPLAGRDGKAGWLLDMDVDIA